MSQWNERDKETGRLRPKVPQRGAAAAAYYASRAALAYRKRHEPWKYKSQWAKDSAKYQRWEAKRAEMRAAAARRGKEEKRQRRRAARAAPSALRGARYCKPPPHVEAWIRENAAAQGCTAAEWILYCLERVMYRR